GAIAQLDKVMLGKVSLPAIIARELLHQPPNMLLVPSVTSVHKRSLDNAVIEHAAPSLYPPSKQPALAITETGCQYTFAVLLCAFASLRDSENHHFTRFATSGSGWPSRYSSYVPR